MDQAREQGPQAQDRQDGYSVQMPTVSLKDYLNIAKRRKWSFILPIVLVVVIGSCVALLLPAVYQSAATILIEEQEIPTEFVAATVTSFVEQRLQQINQRIMSTTRLLEIIERYDLYKKMRANRTTEEVIAQMRADVRLRQISTDLVDRRTGRPTTATIAFSLSYQAQDSPANVQKVANMLVSLFLEENLQVRERQTAETSKFLEDEMHRVQEDLANVETRLAVFKEKHINELPELMQLNIQQLGNTERSIERLEEQMRSIKENEGYLQVQLANLSPFLENSDRNQLNTLETELAMLQSHFTEEHPDVVKTAGAVKTLKEKISRNGSEMDLHPAEPDNPAYITLSSQLASARSEINSIKIQIQDLVKAKSKYQARIDATPKVERAYRELTSEQTNQLAKYDDLMRKSMEAKVAHGLEKGQKGERFTLIDPPRMPEKPFKPNRPAILLIAVVLGIGAGVGWAALREFSDPSIQQPEKLAAATGFPILGAIPIITSQADLRRVRIRNVMVWVTLVVALVAVLGAIHFWVMDLNVVWAKLSRRLIG